MLTRTNLALQNKIIDKNISLCTYIECRSIIYVHYVAREEHSQPVQQA